VRPGGTVRSILIISIFVLVIIVRDKDDFVDRNRLALFRIVPSCEIPETRVRYPLNSETFLRPVPAQHFTVLAMIDEPALLYRGRHG
jgi:hypothetical protein